MHPSSHNSQVGVGFAKQNVGFSGFRYNSAFAHDITITTCFDTSDVKKKVNFMSFVKQISCHRNIGCQNCLCDESQTRNTDSQAKDCSKTKKIRV